MSTPFLFTLGGVLLFGIGYVLGFTHGALSEKAKLFDEIRDEAESREEEKDGQANPLD